MSMVISIVITGFYFKSIRLYEKILSETKLYNEYQFSLYILSHKDSSDIPIHVLEYLIDTGWQIIYKPNVGWDWGCYVQFMQWHVENNLPPDDYVLFLHDDISIIKNGFIAAFLNKTKEGFALLGNSQPFTKITRFDERFSDEAFILEKSNIQYEPKSIKIVRGSALFVSFELAGKALLCLPYQRCGHINMANRSLRLFGAVVTKLAGSAKVGYISEDHFRSAYIVEEMRGRNVSLMFFLRRCLYSIFKKLFHYVDKWVIAKIIFKHTYPIKVENLIQLYVSKNSIRAGYLNYCFENKLCSDVDLRDVENLLSENRVYKILFSDYTTFDDLNRSNSIMQKISLSKIPIDIFIDSENSEAEALNGFLKANEDLKIIIEKIPKRKGTRWINRLYLKYPQDNFTANK